MSSERRCGALGILPLLLAFFWMGHSQPLSCIAVDETEGGCGLVWIGPLGNAKTIKIIPRTASEMHPESVFLVDAFLPVERVEEWGISGAQLIWVRNDSPSVASRLLVVFATSMTHVVGLFEGGRAEATAESCGKDVWYVHLPGEGLEPGGFLVLAVVPAVGEPPTTLVR